jgi:hypothetical protein
MGLMILKAFGNGGAKTLTNPDPEAWCLCLRTRIGRWLFLLVAVSSHPFLSFMLRHFGAFSFPSAGHESITSS